MQFRLAVSFLLAFSPVVHAGEWPQWLGPHRDASTDEIIKPWKGIWKVLWRQPVGEGHSSPVVANGVVYLHTRDGNRNAEVLRAFDADTGKPLWTSKYERQPYKGLFGNGPRATPAVSNGRVYTYGITGVLTCFDAKSGRQLWQVDTIARFKAPRLFFGSSCSPLVEGSNVVVNVGAKGASIVAFDAATGKVTWKTLDDKASYASPIAFGKGINRQIVFLTGEGLVGLAPKDGSVFWQFPFRDKLAESSATPARAGGVLVGSSITRGAVGLSLDYTGQVPRAKKKWFNEKLTSYFSTPVAAGEYLYMVTGTKPPALLSRATLHCVDPKTGKILWSREGVGTYHASLLRTGDDKLLLLEEKGHAVLLDPSPKGYRELARAPVCRSTWAHPAVSNGKFYIRDSRELICLAIPQ